MTPKVQPVTCLEPAPIDFSDYKIVRALDKKPDRQVYMARSTFMNKYCAVKLYTNEKDSMGLKLY